VCLPFHHSGIRKYRICMCLAEHFRRVLSTIPYQYSCIMSTPFGCGCETFYIPHALAVHAWFLFISRIVKRGAPKVRILISRGAGRSIVHPCNLFCGTSHEAVFTSVAWSTWVIQPGGPGAFHTVQTVVFRRTGHHIISVQLVFETITISASNVWRSYSLSTTHRDIIWSRT